MPSSGVRNFVHSYLANRSEPIEKGSRIATTTLPNGTVLAYVFGAAWCGATGGCTLLILTPSGPSYRVIGTRLAVKLPVYVLDSETYGEPQLGLIRAGSGRQYNGGLWYPETIVSFNGHSYGGADTPDPALKLGELKGREAIIWSARNEPTIGAKCPMFRRAIPVIVDEIIPCKRSDPGWGWESAHVRLHARDGSWYGFTDAGSLQPNVPVGTLLDLEGDWGAPLAIDDDSGKQTVIGGSALARLLRYDPRRDASLYVEILDGAHRGQRGWMGIENAQTGGMALGEYDMEYPYKECSDFNAQ